MRFERRIGLGPIELRCKRVFSSSVMKYTEKHRNIVGSSGTGMGVQAQTAGSRTRSRTRMLLFKACFFITLKIRRTKKSYVHHNKNCEICQYDFGKHAIE